MKRLKKKKQIKHVIPQFDERRVIRKFLLFPKCLPKYTATETEAGYHVDGTL